jgi:hypothetical protein
VRFQANPALSAVAGPGDRAGYPNGKILRERNNHVQANLHVLGYGIYVFTDEVDEYAIPVQALWNHY